MERTQAKRFSAKSLKSSRRRTKSLDQTTLVKRSFPEVNGSFPRIIQPTIPDICLSQWVAGEKDPLRKELLSHGAILFRGFGISSVSEFADVCRALADQLYGEYGDLPVENRNQKVYKSTPYPPEKPILFHNESSHMAQWPRLQFFHCVQNSETGGETPLVDCRTLYQALPESLRNLFHAKGLMYVRNFREGLDVSWQHFFQTDDPEVVAQKCHDAGFEHQWSADGTLQVKQFAPAIIQHPVSGEFSFFNQIELHHVAYLEENVRQSLAKVYEESAFPRHVYFGDGTPISQEIIDTITQLYETHSVALPWEKGDVIALENMLVAHARLPYTGARKIIVAMGDMVNQRDVVPAGVAS